MRMGALRMWVCKLDLSMDDTAGAENELMDVQTQPPKFLLIEYALRALTRIFFSSFIRVDVSQVDDGSRALENIYNCC
jgi:hypothetical protein